MKSVERWLEQKRPEAVAEIVQRIYAELPDYRQRPLDQMTAGAANAYGQWCTTVLENDLMRYAREAQAVIEANIARGIDPGQLARVPAIICAVVVAMTERAGPEVNAAELEVFRGRAQRMTAIILGIGGMRIAGEVLKKTIDGSITPPFDPEKPPRK